MELSWTGFVCRLRGVLPPRIQGQVSVQWRFAWFAGRFSAFSFGGFHLFGLPSHGVSVAFRADGLFCTFLRGCCGGRGACISKTRTTPCHAGWRMRG